MAWEKTIALTALKKENRQTVTLQGHKILLIWHADTLYAVQAQCPHFKLPLAKGEINADDALVCPFHHSAFDLKTGHVNCWATSPKLLSPLLGKLSKPKDLRIYDTRVEEDTIFVAVD